MKKRILSMLLACVLLLSALPMGSYAAQASPRYTVSASQDQTTDVGKTVSMTVSVAGGSYNAYDLALTYDLDLPADLHFFPITELPPLVAMSEGHALAHLPAVSIHEIAPHPMVLLDLPMSADYFLSFFTREGLRANIAERTRDIVDGLKRFSALDRDESSRFELGAVVERSVTWVCKAAPERFEVTVDIPDSLPVVGASGPMQQVVMNLVQNACDATARQAEPRLTVSGGIEQGRAVLHFIDNGPGIPEENLSRLFEPFFTTKPVGQGTGLGLSISYGIVDRHGGKLSAGNVAGGGAEFILALPLESA